MGGDRKRERERGTGEEEKAATDGLRALSERSNYQVQIADLRVHLYIHAGIEPRQAERKTHANANVNANRVLSVGKIASDGSRAM